MNKDKISQGIKAFLDFLFWMLVFGFVVRLFEAALLGYYHQEFWKQLSLCCYGYGYDILFFAKFALLLCPLYLLIHYFSEGAARWTFRILGAVMLLISNAMVMYYMSAYLPLDKVFFDYSVKELVYISQSTGAFVWWGYVGLLLIPALFLVVSRRRLNLGHGWMFAWLVLALSALFVWEVPSWLYKNAEEKNTLCNKQEYFWKSLFKKEAKFSRFDSGDLERQRKRIEDFQAMFPEDDFVDFRYPFAHLDQSPDVLSPYFNLNPDKKPNLVFIISEGLSREFSGDRSYYPSATPFLDSNHSLNWLNCMSSSQRTIGVLPTLFGSLPFGKRGFMQSSNTPRFHSLVGILKDNGYQPSFFYGGWTCFDDMCYFLNDMGVEDYLPDYNSYPKDIQSTWGLYDEYLFSESLNYIKQNNTQPRLDIYLTLTTHDPFDYPDKERYTKTYIQWLERDHRLNDIQPSQYEQYASYLYYDDCLRKFFKDYQEMPEYENTIFVITGDHCFNAQSQELEKYHVPFLVWSPMLKAPRRFPAMVAHRDVTPSFLALMKHNYYINAPEVVSWINTGLDTSSVFRANTFTPQLKSSRKMDNMVYKDWFYDEGKVYRFGYDEGRLTLTEVEAEPMASFMSEYRAMDDYVMNNDALIRIDEDKQRLILVVDSTKSVNYVLLNSYVRPIDTLEHENVFKLVNDYPFNLFTMPLSDSLQSVVVYSDFNIRIPRQENGGAKVMLGFELSRHDGTREVIKPIVVNYDWYEHYDRWQHFSMTQTFNRSQLHYQDGDQLKCYFSNGGHIEFMIADFNLKIVEVSE